LTYAEAQQAADGRPNSTTAPPAASVLRSLYGAYGAFERARRKRGTLDLDLPERRIVLDDAGHVVRIEPRARLDSHKLIEEFMIAANVAAAETLERLQRPCLYRVHDSPDPAKLEALRKFLEGINVAGLALAKGQVVRPRHFNDILRKVADTPYATLVPQLVLRSQAQAVYSPMNIGHFGLALRRYAHFTSPIRRYADLLVHRGLIAALALPGNHAEAPESKDLVSVGEQVSMTERRAAAAERSAADRYTAAYLVDRIGTQFLGRINGVTRAGLFVTLAETGADGLVLMRSLPGDYYDHDEGRHRLVGRRTGRPYTLGDEVHVQLAEADTVTGSLRFVLIDDQAQRSPRNSRANRPKDRQA
jgi:ribonuclease R